MPKSGSQMITKRIVNQKESVPREEINRIRSAIKELKDTPKNDPEYTRKYKSTKGRIVSIKNLHPQRAAKLLMQIN